MRCCGQQREVQGGTAIYRRQLIWSLLKCGWSKGRCFSITMPFIWITAYVVITCHAWYCGASPSNVLSQFLIISCCKWEPW
jgi:hypothetical protein